MSQSCQWIGGLRSNSVKQPHLFLLRQHLASVVWRVFYPLVSSDLPKETLLVVNLVFAMPINKLCFNLENEIKSWSSGKSREWLLVLPHILVIAPQTLSP